MNLERLKLAVAVSAALAAVVPSAVQAQTSTASGSTSSTATRSGASTTSATTIAAAATTSPSTSTAPATNTSERLYVRHMQMQARFVTLAGSGTNLQNLVHGLRGGTPVTLTTTQMSGGTQVTQTVTFSPPTHRMGYGNITRALTLASRELAAAGVRNPTPQQLQVALTGGTLTTANGTTSMTGVLQLRSQGTGWGQIAHNIGVPPGQGASTRENAERSAGIRGITTAAGSTRAGSALRRSDRDGSEHALAGERGIVTASGSGSTATFHRASPAETHASTGTVTAAGTSAASIVTASGQNAGPMRGREGRH